MRQRNAQEQLQTVRYTTTFEQRHCIVRHDATRVRNKTRAHSLTTIRLHGQVNTITTNGYYYYYYC